MVGGIITIIIIIIVVVVLVETVKVKGVAVTFIRLVGEVANVKVMVTTVAVVGGGADEVVVERVVPGVVGPIAMVEVEKCHDL